MVKDASSSPLVSVIVVATCDDEIDDIRLHLSRQRFRDFELIVELGGTIPQAWNRAVQRARGRYLVFTETDARPMSEFWLDELVSQMGDDEHVIKGIEVVGTPWNLCNTIMKRGVFEKLSFDEDFLWAEDTDLFSRLSALSFRLEKRETAAVFHGFRQYSPKALRRAFRYGMYWIRIRHRYRSPVEKVRARDLLRQAGIALLQLLGMGVGFFYYWRDRRYRSDPFALNEPVLSPISQERETEICSTGVSPTARTTPSNRQALRVLYIAPFPPTRSGIASYAGDYYNAIERYSERCIIERFPDVVHRPCPPNVICEEIAKLHDHLRQWMPDIIHIETGYGLLREFYLLLSLPAQRPYRVVVTVHDPPCMAGEPLRFIGDANSSIAEMEGVIGPQRIRDMSRELEEKAYNHTDSVIVLSRTGAEVLGQQFGDHQHLRVVPHGVDLPHPRAAAPNQPLRLLCFGYFHKDKGVEVLLDALKRLPPRSVVLHLVGQAYRLTLAGADANERYRSEILQSARGERFPQEVIVHDYVPQADLDNTFAQCDVLVLPNRKSGIASTSGVLVRGMAHGMAVVCTEVRSLPDLIKSGENGILVPPDSPEKMADALTMLLDDPGLIGRLGTAAYKTARSSHTWQNVSKMMDSVYGQFRKPD